MSFEQRMTHKNNKTFKTSFNMKIFVSIAFSQFISARCITRMELHSAFKMLLMKENAVITQKDLRSKHMQGTTQAGSQLKMSRVKWWARLNIPGHVATLKGENSRE